MMPSDSNGFNILIFVTNDNVCLCLRVIPCYCSCSEIQDQAMNGNQRTMELRDKLLEFLPAMSRNLSFYDVAEITKAYQCTGRHRRRTIIDRSRELFISPVARDIFYNFIFEKT